MTSNLGANFLNASENEGPISPHTKELVNGAIRGHFAPEFINRIDAIIVRLPLGGGGVVRGWLC
jgi:ATP-dependent Clp protease ATP-binding subunit ClpB